MSALFIVFSAFADINPSRLSITTGINAALSIEVDGNRYDRVPGSLVLDDINAGYHKIKVYEVRQERRGFRKTDVYNLIYSSSVIIKPMHHMNIRIAPDGRVRIDEEVKIVRFGHVVVLPVYCCGSRTAA